MAQYPPKTHSTKQWMIPSVDSPVSHIRDDFIIFGKNGSEHNIALKKLLKRLANCGLTANPKKCKCRMPQIEFFGFTFSSKGIQPAPSKIEALRKMPPPQTASLLGMAQYSAQFIPNFAELTTPLRRSEHMFL